MASDTPERDRRATRRVIATITVLVLVGVIVAILLDHGIGLTKGIPKGLIDPIRAALVLVVGGAISIVLERKLLKAPETPSSPLHRMTSLRFGIRLMLYLAILLALLAAFGVGLSSLVFGGAFVTVIIGMAGQTLFGNLLAGIGIVFFHPFQIGEHISFVTDQYPLMSSTFPHESGRPGYRGTVIDMNLMYTHLFTDDGVAMMVPNGIIIQAAIENLSRIQALQVRLRFDVDMTLAADVFTARAQAALSDLGTNVRAEVVDIGLASYGVAVQVLASADANPDQIRHQMALRLLPILIELKQSARSEG